MENKEIKQKRLKNLSIKKGMIQTNHRIWLEMITNIHFRRNSGIIEMMLIKFENLEKRTDWKISWDFQVSIMNSHKLGLFFLIKSWANSEPEGHPLPSHSVPHPYKLYPESASLPLATFWDTREKNASTGCLQPPLCAAGERPTPLCSWSAFFCGRGLRVSNILGILGSQGQEQLQSSLPSWSTRGRSGNQGSGQCWGCW